MDTISGAALARELGTSVPRVTRAIEQLGIDARQANGRFALTSLQANRVRRVLGVFPRADGLTRSETAVLAALRNAPFGLISTRAVSRRSGLSPTAAGRALQSLRLKELVGQVTETLAAGRAQKMTIWRANLSHPSWPDLDPVLERARKPERPEQAGERVPRRLRHLFWNTAESQLDVSRAGAYIARRLLQTTDLQGLAWGAQTLKPEDWERGALARGLDSKVTRLARNLAQASRCTAVAVHLGHREIFDASQLNQLTKPEAVAGLHIAGLHDLMAMKIKVMAERGEMRDYFDVKTIDEKGAVSVEEGIELYMRRYEINPSSDAIPHLYKAMGDLSDVEVDDLLPIGMAELQEWWSECQVRVLRNSNRFG